MDGAKVVLGSAGDDETQTQFVDVVCCDDLAAKPHDVAAAGLIGERPDVFERHDDPLGVVDAQQTARREVVVLAHCVAVEPAVLAVGERELNGQCTVDVAQLDSDRFHVLPHFCRDCLYVYNINNFIKQVVLH